METAAASIRLLVIDIDGTLLTPEGTITAPTLAAVQAVQQAGIVVTLATARRYCNTVKIANELGLDTPLILYDGAMIVQHPLPTVTPAPTTTLTPTATPTLAPGVAAFVQGKAQLGAGLTMSVSYTSSVTRGSLLVGLFRTEAGTTVSDNVNGAWTQAINGGVNSIWYRANAAGGPTTVTVTGTTSGSIRAAVSEYRGISMTNPLDATTCQNGMSSTLITGMTVAVKPGELIFAALGTHTTGETATAGGSDGVSAVLRNQATGWQGTVADEDIISGAGGVQDATMYLSGWAAWTGCVATFRTGG